MKSQRRAARVVVVDPIQYVDHAVILADRVAISAPMSQLIRVLRK